MSVNKRNINAIAIVMAIRAFIYNNIVGPDTVIEGIRNIQDILRIGYLRQKREPVGPPQLAATEHTIHTISANSRCAV